MHKYNLVFLPSIDVSGHRTKQLPVRNAYSHGQSEQRN